MKKLMIVLVTTFFSTGLVFAQPDNSDIDIVQALFGKSKRLIIEEYIKLDEKSERQFWPVYDEYEKKRKIIEKERFLLLSEYATNYETLDAAKAGKLVKAFIETSDKYNRLHKIYFRKVEKIIGGLEAATFIQLETFIQTSLQSSLQSEVPIIGELDKKKFNQKNEN